MSEQKYTEVTFDINKLFDATKDTLEKQMLTLQGKIELLEDLKNYFSTNRLKVMQEVPNTDLDSKAKTAE